MPRSLSAIKLNVKLSATLRNLLDDAVYASVNHPGLNYSPTLDDGIGDNQANRSWQSLSRALNWNASETLDLYDLGAVDIGAGAGRDGLGQPIAFEDVVAIAIVNDNAVDETGQLEIIPAVANGWTPIGEHTVANGGALRGQGILLKAQIAEDGFDVEDGVSHQITLTAREGNVEYSIYLLTRHDDEESTSSSSWSSHNSSSSSSISTSSISTSSPSSSSWSSHSSSSLSSVSSPSSSSSSSSSSPSSSSSSSSSSSISTSSSSPSSISTSSASSSSSSISTSSISTSAHESWFIWWHSGSSTWIINHSVGEFLEGGWSLNTPSIEGIYGPGGSYSGYPKVDASGADYEVTYDTEVPVPDCRGTYVLAGTYGGENYYVRS